MPLLSLLALKLAQDALAGVPQAQRVSPHNRILPVQVDATKTYGKRPESARRGYRGQRDGYLGMVKDTKLYLVKVPGPNWWTSPKKDQGYVPNGAVGAVVLSSSQSGREIQPRPNTSHQMMHKNWIRKTKKAGTSRQTKKTKVTAVEYKQRRSHSVVLLRSEA